MFAYFVLYTKSFALYLKSALGNYYAPISIWTIKVVLSVHLSTHELNNEDLPGLGEWGGCGKFVSLRKRAKKCKPENEN